MDDDPRARDGAQVTALLRAQAAGTADALEPVIPLVYEELRRLAAAQLVRERDGHTLGTTALVHEAYLRLVDVRDIAWQDRVHFFAMAARVMRRVLVDHARARGRAKRGGGIPHLPLSEAEGVADVSVDDLLILDALLHELEHHNARQARVVECRCFAGLSVAETARAVDASEATVKRDWAFARAWLNRALTDDADPTRAEA